MQAKRSHQKNPEKPESVWVRCLGTSKTEHHFLSEDKARDRICAKCREKMEKQLRASRYHEPPTRMEPQ